MATPNKKCRLPSIKCNKVLGSTKKKRRHTTEEINHTLSEILSLTSKCQMSEVNNDLNKRFTRSSTKKSNPGTKSTKAAQQRLRSAIEGSSSPTLRGKKRPSQGDLSGDEPASKRMAEDKILDAIKGVSASVASMEARMSNFSTKADLNSMVDEIKDVKEKVVVNSLNIEKLFDMRRSDREGILKKVEEIVDNKITVEAAMGASRTASYEAEKEAKYLLCRRSLRVWPISEVGELDVGVRTFLKRYLKIPTSMADNMSFEHLERVAQPRRSKVHKEVLIRFLNTQTRDTVQSFAPNLAEAAGTACLRMEIPDFLRGLFRTFEMHAAALRAKYGQVKRSIRFDDAGMSLVMDVKLENTQWHRINADEVRAAEKRSEQNGPAATNDPSQAKEKRKILLLSPENSDASFMSAES